jgi:hypothetical protein
VTRVVLAVAWFGVVLGSLAALERYKSQPGEAATAPAQWPARSALARDAGKPTLLVFAHPKCPCTRATVKELSRLLARIGSQVSAQVLFVKPEGVAVDWPKTDLWAQAERIAKVSVDEQAVEAARFGSATSGQVLLYGADGSLQFSGGITIARGHEGDSPGAARIVELVNNGKAELAEAPVFGCPLHDEGEQR